MRNKISYKNKDGKEITIEFHLLDGESLEIAKNRICADGTFLWFHYEKKNLGETS